MAEEKKQPRKMSKRIRIGSIKKKRSRPATKGPRTNGTGPRMTEESHPNDADSREREERDMP